MPKLAGFACAAPPTPAKLLVSPKLVGVVCLVGVFFLCLFLFACFFVCLLLDLLARSFVCLLRLLVCFFVWFIVCVVFLIAYFVD